MVEKKLSLWKYLRLIGPVVLLFIILSKVDLLKVFLSLAKINALLLLFVSFLNIPQIFLKSLRWKQMLGTQSIQYNMKNAFVVYWAGIYAGIVTPGKLGEFIKAVYLKSDKGISLSKGMSSVLIDRLFDLYLLIILGFIGIWKCDILGKLSNISLLLLFILVLFPLVILNKQLAGKVVGLIYKSVIKKKFQLRDKIEERFEDFYNGVHQLINPNLLFSGFLTCIAYMVFFIQCCLIAIAMGISVNFITITLFMSISSLISLVPISISGLGTRDATLIYLFSLIGFKPEIAVSYSFLVFIVFFVCGGLMGAVAGWMKPVTITSCSKNAALK